MYDSEVANVRKLCGEMTGFLVLYCTTGLLFLPFMPWLQKPKKFLVCYWQMTWCYYMCIAKASQVF